MDWIEAVVSTTPEGVEPVSAVLLDAGITGIQIEDDEEMKRFIQAHSAQWDYVDDDLLQKPPGDTSVIFYVPADSYGRETLMAVETGLKRLCTTDTGLDLGKLTLRTRNVDDTDWLNNWKKYFKPFRIGRLVVKPSWEEYTPEAGDLVLHMNPGHVFGTGLHQSTRMCMEALENTVRSGGRIADLGCGSGILSVLALVLGADYAFACDIESSARDVAYENAGLNGIGPDRYDVEICNILTDKPYIKQLAERPFDIVVANIVADVIIALAPLVPLFIRPGGVFIVSGIIKDRQDEVLAALAHNGFILRDINVMDEWVACTAVYQSQSGADA